MSTDSDESLSPTIASTTLGANVGRVVAVEPGARKDDDPGNPSRTHPSNKETAILEHIILSLLRYIEVVERRSQLRLAKLMLCKATTSRKVNTFLHQFFGRLTCLKPGFSDNLGYGKGCRCDLSGVPIFPSQLWIRVRCTSSLSIDTRFRKSPPCKRCLLLSHWHCALKSQ